MLSQQILTEQVLLVEEYVEDEDETDDEDGDVWEVSNIEGSTQTSHWHHQRDQQGSHSDDLLETQALNHVHQRWCSS